MTKFYVTLNLEVEADNVDDARQVAYDMYFYGEDEAIAKSDFAVISSYNVEVDEE